MEESGVQVVRCPLILLEDKLLSRLRSGAAKKSLNTLGVLSRLVQLVTTAAEKAYASKGRNSSSLEDVDEVVSGYGVV
jgi:hypothetical protein